jgi:hypothetical protein
MQGHLFGPGSTKLTQPGRAGWLEMVLKNGIWGRLYLKNRKNRNRENRNLTMGWESISIQ